MRLWISSAVLTIAVVITACSGGNIAEQEPPWRAHLQNWRYPAYIPMHEQASVGDYASWREGDTVRRAAIVSKDGQFFEVEESFYIGDAEIIQKYFVLRDGRVNRAYVGRFNHTDPVGRRAPPADDASTPAIIDWTQPTETVSVNNGEAEYDCVIQEIGDRKTYRAIVVPFSHVVQIEEAGQVTMQIDAFGHDQNANPARLQIIEDMWNPSDAAPEGAIAE
jgi:hypothetical protein